MTKEIMLQYETIRHSGICNMFDYNCVIATASRLRFFDLAAVTYEEYKDLLLNFSKYMKEFRVERIEESER